VLQELPGGVERERDSVFVDRVGRNRHERPELRQRLAVSACLRQGAGEGQSGGRGLHRVVCRPAGVAIQVRCAAGPGGAELGAFRLPDALCKRTLPDEPSRLGRPFVVFPRQDDRTPRHPRHQRDRRIIVLVGLEDFGPNGQSRDLPKGGPLEVRDQLLTELPRDATALVAPPGRVELTLLDDEAQAEADQRGAREEDRRQEEQDLSPVEL
jgi:hypothetical protein